MIISCCGRGGFSDFGIGTPIPDLITFYKALLGANDEGQVLLVASQVVCDTSVARLSRWVEDLKNVLAGVDPTKYLVLQTIVIRMSNSSYFHPSASCGSQPDGGALIAAYIKHGSAIYDGLKARGFRDPIDSTPPDPVITPPIDDDDGDTSEPPVDDSPVKTLPAASGNTALYIGAAAIAAKLLLF